MQTVLFDTAAYHAAGAKAWIVPLHGWAYRAQRSSVRKSAIAALFKSKYGLTPQSEHEHLFDDRINLLLADNVPRAAPPLLVGRRVFVMPPTSANGHSRLLAMLPFTDAPEDTIGFGIAAQDGPGHARSTALGPTGGSVICDIDDTVKDSGVLDRRRLWDSTFFKPFVAVPGMADLLRRLSGPVHASRAVHYVSSSPWHLYEPLRSWLLEAGFPCASLHLKHIRLKDSTILDILKSPEATKPPVIAALLKQYPRRSFTLVGDSGEKDPEVYGTIARQFSRQTTRILIRRAPGDTSAMSRFDTAFAGLPRALWQVFDDPAEVL